MKGCQTIEESLESLVAASKEYTKNHESGESFSTAFYPTMWHHQMTCYLKLVKRKARFSYSKDVNFGGGIVWEVEEFY